MPIALAQRRFRHAAAGSRGENEPQHLADRERVAHRSRDRGLGARCAARGADRSPPGAHDVRSRRRERRGHPDAGASARGRPGGQRARVHRRQPLCHAARLQSLDARRGGTRALPRARRRRRGGARSRLRARGLRRAQDGRTDQPAAPPQRLRSAPAGEATVLLPRRPDALATRAGRHRRSRRVRLLRTEDGSPRRVPDSARLRAQRLPSLQFGTERGPGGRGSRLSWRRRAEHGRRASPGLPRGVRGNRDPEGSPRHGPARPYEHGCRIPLWQRLRSGRLPLRREPTWGPDGSRPARLWMDHAGLGRAPHNEHPGRTPRP